MDAKSRRERRKQKILNNTTSRIQKVTGETSELKEEPVRIDSTGLKVESIDLLQKKTFDPTLRRRQAAIRKQEKEKQLQEQFKEIEETVTKTTVLSTVNKQLQFLRFQQWMKLVHTVLLVCSGLTLAFQVNIQDIYTPSLASQLDDAYLPYIALFEQGIAVESIQQKMLTENLDPSKILPRSAFIPKTTLIEDDSWSYFLMHPMERLSLYVLKLIETPPALFGIVLGIHVLIAGIVFIVHRIWFPEIVYNFAGDKNISNNWIVNMVFNMISSSSAFGNLPLVIKTFASIFEEYCIIIFIQSIAAAIRLQWNY